jgi:hypothetical protein
MKKSSFKENSDASSNTMLNAYAPKLVPIKSITQPGEKSLAEFYVMPDGTLYKIYQIADTGEFIIATLHGFEDPATEDICIGWRDVYGDIWSLPEALDTLTANHEPSDGCFEIESLA